METIEESQLEEKCEESICEWCGANWTEGDTCDELRHYTNR